MVTRLRQLVRRPRPFSLHRQHEWRFRTEAAVALFEAHNPPGGLITVADLGAGNTLVGQLIHRPETEYRGYDLLPQTGSVTQLDVRDGLPSGNVDVAFVLGLIEYVEPENAFIERLAGFARQAIVSYVPPGGDVSTAEARARLDWRRHESLDETEARFQAAGFVRRSAEILRDTSVLWLWEQPNPPDREDRES
jgi:hypothetical protein